MDASRAAQDGFGVIGPAGNIIYMSPSMRHLTGFTAAEMEGCVRLQGCAQRRPSDARKQMCSRARTLVTSALHSRQVYEQSIVHPDDRARLATHLRDSMLNARDVHIAALDPIRLRRLRKDGTWARLEVVAVRHVRGVVVHTPATG